MFPSVLPIPLIALAPALISSTPGAGISSFAGWTFLVVGSLVAPSLDWVAETSSPSFKVTPLVSTVQFPWSSTVTDGSSLPPTVTVTVAPG